MKMLDSKFPYPHQALIILWVIILWITPLHPFDMHPPLPFIPLQFVYTELDAKSDRKP